MFFWAKKNFFSKDCTERKFDVCCVSARLAHNCIFRLLGCLIRIKDVCVWLLPSDISSRALDFLHYPITVVLIKVTFKQSRNKALALKQELTVSDPSFSFDQLTSCLMSRFCLFYNRKKITLGRLASLESHL